MVEALEEALVWVQERAKAQLGAEAPLQEVRWSERHAAPDCLWCEEERPLLDEWTKVGRRPSGSLSDQPLRLEVVAVRHEEVVR